VKKPQAGNVIKGLNLRKAENISRGHLSSLERPSKYIMDRIQKQNGYTLILVWGKCKIEMPHFYFRFSEWSSDAE
jgi:hypothetical protein